MAKLSVHILTPEKEVLRTDATMLTCYTRDGEITILPHHVPLLSLLSDGIITVREENKERYFSAGSGYVETDGTTVRVLISHASGQDDLDEKRIAEVEKEAQNLLQNYKDKKDRDHAMSMLRRATLDLKVLRRSKRRWQ
ncbi:MAG: ATP synthase F1 subunit epsilon [Candidatus Roizmanbacteria bacterium]|nr:ATP synthase F1 subunit epsilon [Candidatus Roizmanbacteria bacterium]